MYVVALDFGLADTAETFDAKNRFRRLVVIRVFIVFSMGWLLGFRGVFSWTSPRFLMFGARFERACPARSREHPVAFARTHCSLSCDPSPPSWDCTRRGFAASQGLSVSRRLSDMEKQG